MEVGDGGTFKVSSCFIPTPFFHCVQINAGTNNPLELIPMVIHAGDEFDRENATLDKDYERAINHVEFKLIGSGVYQITRWGKPITSFDQEMTKLQNNPINSTKIASWDLSIRRRTPNH